MIEAGGGRVVAAIDLQPELEAAGHVALIEMSNTRVATSAKPRSRLRAMGPVTEGRAVGEDNTPRTVKC